MDDDGKYRTISAGVNAARLNGSLLDVESTPLQLKLVIADANAKLASCNPWRDAVSNPDAIYAKIPLKRLRGMGRRDIITVLDTINEIAREHVQ